jgi:hypothetical protein
MNKQLSAVSREFDTWRMQREKRTHTPKVLIAKAVALRNSYSDAHIIKALKLNSTTLKQWAKREDVIPAEAFVELPVLPPAIAVTQKSMPPQKVDNSTLQIGLPSGTTLTLSGDACSLANFVAQLATKGAV